jgi:hypothetical protein
MALDRRSIAELAIISADCPRPLANKIMGSMRRVLSRPDGAMTEPDCKLCRDEGWVCEEHLDQPMRHDGCRRAGVPCPDCNPLAGRTSHQHRRGALRPPSIGNTAGGNRAGGQGPPAFDSWCVFQSRP